MTDDTRTARGTLDWQPLEQHPDLVGEDDRFVELQRELQCVIA